ncbi:hypothetical protein M422DRAFT_256975 [Sphaerobolus stellatus SS14]|uniref:Uncharacterized protein n=1 Tax=Sphaerobolus stellatus (strain SS14) TaxID=990650 RepID=A0A0C9VQG6_SPHS4|nr:hypothetical protein M422DRAFT_256975 [Sphaerobolus stellatus SS14]
MPDSKPSQASSSSNAADLLSQFRNQQAKHDENRVESFNKEEILRGLHEAWPHISAYIFDLNEEWAALEKELYQETADNCQLQDEKEDLQERIHELEAQLESLQPSPNLISSVHPLTSLVMASYLHKRSHKLDENEDFRNRILKYDAQPDHWSLHMWQALVGWHKNLMSVPNALQEDAAGYFLKENVDVAAWLNKVSSNLPRQAIMNCMKAVFGSCINFETAFSGFDLNLLRPVFQQTRWITDSSMPLHIDSQITKGIKGKSQIEAVKMPTRSDFLTLILNHCSLFKEQIYNKIIPYMIRDDEKQPLSTAAVERAAYMVLQNRESAHYKGKKPLTGTGQSRISAHVPYPAQVGQSSQQRLDADLADYNNQCKPVLPYSEEPPSGEPETGGNVPPQAGASSTLHDESTMNIDPKLDDIYR